MHHSIDVTFSNQSIESFSFLALAQNEGRRAAVEDTYKVSNLRNGGNDACITPPLCEIQEGIQEGNRDGYRSRPARANSSIAFPLSTNIAAYLQTVISKGES